MSLPSTQRAQERRLLDYVHENWVEAMVLALRSKALSHFRWFSSGDLQSKEMFEKIKTIARGTPEIQHWLPTQQRNYISFEELPENLTVRVSNVFFNSLPDTRYPTTSTVSTKPVDFGYMCPASFSKPRNCLACRACWDKNVPVVVYKKH